MENRSKRMSWLILGLLTALGTYFGFKSTARGAYESAEYAVVRAEGAFEIREYPELMLASTESAKAADDDGSFMRLFGFISGKNEQEQQIAMTTPVFMQPQTGEAPGRMDFVMPKQVARQGVPEPTNSDVTIGKRTKGRFAVIRFSGRMSAEMAADMETKLREWIKGQGLSGKGEAEIAVYDPPWTPGPLRRNEVLIRLTDIPTQLTQC